MHIFFFFDLNLVLFIFGLDFIRWSKTILKEKEQNKIKNLFYVHFKNSNLNMNNITSVAYRISRIFWINGDGCSSSSWHLTKKKLKTKLSFQKIHDHFNWLLKKLTKFRYLLICWSRNRVPFQGLPNSILSQLPETRISNI